MLGRGGARIQTQVGLAPNPACFPQQHSATLGGTGHRELLGRTDREERGSHGPGGVHFQLAIHASRAGQHKRASGLAITAQLIRATEKCFTCISTVSSPWEERATGELPPSLLPTKAMNYLVLLVSQEPQEKDQKGRAMGLGWGWGGCGGWNEWMNEYVVLEKKLKKLEKSYDPAFRELRGNVARKG